MLSDFFLPVKLPPPPQILVYLLPMTSVDFVRQQCSCEKRENALDETLDRLYHED